VYMRIAVIQTATKYSEVVNCNSNVKGEASESRFKSSQSQSHIATDGRSISKTWCRAPSGAHDQIFIIV
jgi:hypothetical protein